MSLSIAIVPGAKMQADVCYGQGVPSSNQARRGLRRYTSRCHVCDVCRVLHASMLQPAAGVALLYEPAQVHVTLSALDIQRGR